MSPPLVDRNRRVDLVKRFEARRRIEPRPHGSSQTMRPRRGSCGLSTGPCRHLLLVIGDDHRRRRARRRSHPGTPAQRRRPSTAPPAAPNRAAGGCRRSPPIYRREESRGREPQREIAHLTVIPGQVKVCQMPRSFSRIAGRPSLRGNSRGNVAWLIIRQPPPWAWVVYRSRFRCPKFPPDSPAPSRGDGGMPRKSGAISGSVQNFGGAVI